MPSLVRLLLIYAAAFCLILSAFGLAPIVAVAGRGVSPGVVPWLLVVGGLLGAFDCWRLSRRLSKRMAAGSRDRWTDSRIELFARPHQDLPMALASLTLAAVVLFALLVGLPNTGKWRPDRPFPSVDIQWTVDASGQRQAVVSDPDMRKLKEYYSIPRTITLDGWRAALLLAAFGIPGLLVWNVQSAFRRDGRPSLVLDEHGLDHAWTGRIPWQRVHGMALGGTHRQAHPFLYLLVADPAPLRKRLPWRVNHFELRPIPPDEPFGEILLSLYPFECDERRLMTVAKRLQAAAGPPLNRDWRPGINIEYVRGLNLTPAAPAPDRTPSAGPAHPASAPSRADLPGLSLGDRLSIAWVTSLSLLAAAQLLAVLLLGADTWTLMGLSIEP